VPGRAIGAIDIYDDFTFVDVPAEYQAQVLAGMSGITIRGREANIRLATSRDVPPPRARRAPKQRTSSTRPKRKPAASKGKKARRNSARKS
jgi:ATP-dependent RNA helicase DeaD